MKRPVVTVLASLALTGLLPGGPALSQSPPPAYTRPAVSPYINLVRPDASAGVNYYGIVRPELEFRGNIRQLQQRQAELGTELVSQQQPSALPPTGHPVQFGNEGNYFFT